MKKFTINEPTFQEIEAPVYTKKECHDIISVVCNCMSEMYKYDCNLFDIEEYLDRFPYIRKETIEHILNVLTAHAATYE